MMKAIVLDYNTLSVCVEIIPDDVPAEFSLIDLDYRLDSISYMCVDDDEPVPVYFCDADKPIAKL